MEYHRRRPTNRSKLELLSYPQAPNIPGYHHDVAPLLLARGEVRAAVHHYRRAFELNPSDINSKNDVATVLWRMGKWEAALAALCQVVSINNDHFEGHLNLSAVFYSKGQYDRAAFHARKATQLRPSDPKAHRTLGQVLDQMGNSTKSLHHRRIAVRRGPGVLVGTGIGGECHPQDTHTYKKLSAQLAMRGKSERQDGHAFMDAYRAMCGKRVELANSERTKEILQKCLR